MHALRLAPVLLAFTWLGCPAEAPTAPSPDSGADTAQTQPVPLGSSCRQDSDCIAGVCLYSEYGPPFCTRTCDADGQPCTAGADVTAGNTLCVSYENPPTLGTPAFKGAVAKFCVPRCTDVDSCLDGNSNWEACDVPKWLGDPIYPNLGSLKVCLAPSYQGKDPVDPSTCDWEKTIVPQFNSEANLCRSYCAYLDKCKELPTGADLTCCQWGCFNRMVQDGQKVDAWFDQVKCHLDIHGSLTDVGQANSCSEPPVQCCPNSAGCPHFPEDPTPPAAAL